ncbi:hypothetical protein PHYSODRAFT_317641 [Phytophthora sojae]|uniref:Uncharacterized protein n=1 Tax=Phytophthora sojae (strain P6497) TaxID=1094619 RepID=G4ZY79_PHYSP|nr:hypothetical protein PHYSODRAFT_317641 [Phytophthora sojae]EGZ12691.1 hypothetical protein PHYSODRAFT_317641 [Phytophthora sojae]|eukprot:XP_009533024.1 hypothetical protein PHYSODRAFT_317641 [Phytophthora sojae]
MESVASSGGVKRKHKENAFTAKAETGTLKVKILRRDQRHAANAPLDAATNKTKGRRAARQPPPAPDSPPKPRPNRKHVPIFYEPQFRQPIKRGGSSQSHSSSTDESVIHSTSSTGVPGIHSTSSTDVSASVTGASTSSTTSSFVSQLSDIKIQSASSSAGEVGPPPRSNPLFARNDSDGLGTLGDLLRPYFPSPSAGLQPIFTLGGTQSTGTASAAGLLGDQPGLSSALHQLTSSSASYRTALDALSSAARAPANSSPVDGSTTDTSAHTSSVTTTASAPTSDTTHNGASGGLETYRFDPLAALQTAINHARRASTSSDGSKKQQEPREIGSPNSNARFYRLEPNGSAASATATATSLGPPPELPPAFTLQNSLMGGGIQGLSSFKPLGDRDASKDDKSSDDNRGKNAVAMLGPPPDAPPSFLLQNSLTGGGISMLNLPKSHPTLDKLGLLTRLISQANETAKDLTTAPSSPPKTNLSLDRLVSLTSVASEDGETTKDTNTASTSTEDNSGAVDLGPPPSGPPAFTIGNSLMGGGIDLQPAATNVNTHNFDWKLHRSASTNGGNVLSSPSATRGLSHSLRERLERTLASTQNGSDKS